MKQIPQLRAADRRLIRGYGPLILALAAFLMITAMVPTVAPEQTVALAGDAVPGTEVPGTTGAPGTPVGGSQVPGGGTPTAGGPAALPPGAKVGNCKGPQVPGDPYSPACVTFSGNNGGATYRGVTDKEIVVTWMNPTDGSKSVNEQIAAVIGGFNDVIFPETYEQMLATMQDLVTYFNKNFQFYGRKIVLKVYNGQQNFGGDKASQVNADALKVANTYKAFAEINATNFPYASALTKQGVVNFGNQFGSDEFYQGNAPYSWTTGVTCTQMARDLAAVALKSLDGKPAQWAGRGVDKSKNRRFAVLAPDVPVYQQCSHTLQDELKRGGHPADTVINYPFVLAQASSIAQNMTQKIINEKATTVLCLCDPIALLLIGNNLANSDYIPEFFSSGIAGLETDVFGQLMNQDAWAHSVTLNEQNGSVVGKYGSTHAYFAARSVRPGAFVVNEVDWLYLRLYQLAMGIQLAGPNLTPQTFAQGLYSYPGAMGPFGRLDWNVGGRTFQSPAHEFRLQWWDGKAYSSYDGLDGAWQVLPQWYTSAGYNLSAPRLFPKGIE